MKAIRSTGILFVLATTAIGVAHADQWVSMATVSDTMGTNTYRLCVGVSDTQPMVGCPTTAPSVTTAGDVSVTGNLSANIFIGNGSGLTGISVTPDRITSGTTSIVANSATSSISFTVAGTQAMTISNSGNVGIRTVTPTNALTVNGTLDVGDTFTTMPVVAP